MAGSAPGSGAENGSAFARPRSIRANSSSLNSLSTDLPNVAKSRRRQSGVRRRCFEPCSFGRIFWSTLEVERRVECPLPNVFDRVLCVKGDLVRDTVAKVEVVLREEIVERDECLPDGLGGIVEVLLTRDCRLGEVNRTPFLMMNPPSSASP